MAKTLNQFLEGKTAATGYLKVKSPDEQKFVDKHVRVTNADRNGNGDEVFKASKIKVIDRKFDLKGYNPGEDEKVYESLESVDEVAPPGKEKMVKDIKKSYSKDGVLTAKEKAIAYATAWKAKKANEEVEQVEEATLSAKAARAGKDIGKPGKNFEKIAKSAAEKYGSKEAGQKVAGAILKKMRANEEVEEFVDLLATGEVVFANEEVRSISEREVTLIAAVLNKLSEENQVQFCEVAISSPDGFDKMLSFAIQNKGE
jgi:hypothetical protein